jgi:hypothetical protein
VPTDEPRLEQALHDAAPAVGTTDVVEKVTQRRVRRRRNRRATQVALGVVLLLVVGTLTIVVTRGDGSSPNIATQGSQLHARVVTGNGLVSGDSGAVVVPKRVTLDADAHLLRPPMLVGTSGLSVASYDPGVEGITPSHVVRIDGTHLQDIVDFKARILSLADGEGARWAVTQNHSPTLGHRLPDSFLKRIPATGEATTFTLPVDSDPVGPVAASGGAVWVPVRDGVLLYKTDGSYVRHIPLPDADARWIAQVGKLAYVTDGTSLRGLDAATGTVVDTVTFGPQILGLASASADGRVLLANETGGTNLARVARANTASPVAVTATLPDGFAPSGLAASPTRVWATGTVDGAPAIALLGDHGVRATVVLENAGAEVALVWTGPHTVRAVTGDQLYDIDVP